MSVTQSRPGEHTRRRLAGLVAMPNEGKVKDGDTRARHELLVLRDLYRPLAGRILVRDWPAPGKAGPNREECP